MRSGTTNIIIICIAIELMFQSAVNRHATSLYTHISRYYTISRSRKKKWNLIHISIVRFFEKASQSSVFICDGWRTSIGNSCICVFVREQSTKRSLKKKRQKPISDQNTESHGESRWKKKFFRFYVFVAYARQWVWIFRTIMSSEEHKNAWEILIKTVWNENTWESRNIFYCHRRCCYDFDFFLF